MSHAVYPYRVGFVRTPDWYTTRDGKEGDWSKIASWCDECIGKGEWEYYNNEFVFAQQKHYMLFRLKWL